ncbi:phage holin family protein [Sphingobacterium psychroaquaticum]|uniref:Putative Holin-X, holin superfamily III n=1 Tax=Sphingobacterium psychroaquaticum TaxID=561061 RepID=A0A1X7KIS3_9SPHI|nr:phage holin family protein [Sphingobacterium psychroaquaticum]SMG41308.1 Putative Holin-X, holin superfamily III [Sphingobacterium psychroaquaticum]
MEEEKFSFNNSFLKGKEYVDTQIRLAQLKAIDKGSRVFGSVVVDITKLIFALLVLFFFSLALGFFLGELLNSYALGFFLTGCIFLVVIFILNLLEPKLEARFRDAIIRKLTKKWDDEEKNETINSSQHEEYTQNK